VRRRGRGRGQARPARGAGPRRLGRPVRPDLGLAVRARPGVARAGPDPHAGGPPLRGHARRPAHPRDPGLVGGEDQAHGWRRGEGAGLLPAGRRRRGRRAPGGVRARGGRGLPALRPAVRARAPGLPLRGRRGAGLRRGPGQAPRAGAGERAAVRRSRLRRRRLQAREPAARGRDPRPGRCRRGRGAAALRRARPGGGAALGPVVGRGLGRRLRPCADLRGAGGRQRVPGRPRHLVAGVPLLLPRPGRDGGGPVRRRGGLHRPPARADRSARAAVASGPGRTRRRGFDFPERYGGMA
jgi:hypothetical protein